MGVTQNGGPGEGFYMGSFLKAATGLESSGVVFLPGIQPQSSSHQCTSQVLTYM